MSTKQTVTIDWHTGDRCRYHGLDIDAALQMIRERTGCIDVAEDNFLELGKRLGYYAEVELNCGPLDKPAGEMLGSSHFFNGDTGTKGQTWQRTVVIDSWNSRDILVIW